MKQVPFLAFPPREQDEVLRVLRNAGVPSRTACVSRHQGPEPSAGDCSFTTVTTPNWCRTYDDRTQCNWIAALEQELACGTLPV